MGTGRWIPKSPGGSLTRIALPTTSTRGDTILNDSEAKSRTESERRRAGAAWARCLAADPRGRDQTTWVLAIIWPDAVRDRPRSRRGERSGASPA